MKVRLIKKADFIIYYSIWLSKIYWYIFISPILITFIFFSINSWTIYILFQLYINKGIIIITENHQIIFLHILFLIQLLGFIEFLPIIGRIFEDINGAEMILLVLYRPLITFSSILFVYSLINGIVNWLTRNYFTLIS